MITASVSLLTCYGMMTTAGSVRLMTAGLNIKLHRPDISFTSASGNLASGLTLKDFRIDTFDINGRQGSLSTDYLKIRAKISFAGIPAEAESEGVSLTVEDLFESASASKLKFKNKILEAESVKVHNPSLIRGDSAWSAESVQINLPIQKDGSVRIENTDVQTPSGYIRADRIIADTSKAALEEITIEKSPFLGVQSSVQIQKLRMSAPFDWKHITAVENGRLNMIESDTILFYGTHQNGHLDFNVYSKSVELEPLLSSVRPLAGVTAAVGDADLNLTGAVDNAEVSGNFVIQYLAYRRFYLTGDPSVDLSLRLKPVEGKLDLTGRAELNGGEIVHKKLRLKLQPGKIMFKGNPEIPVFEFKADTLIGKTKVSIQLKGTPDNPDVTLSSSPPYPEEKILIMLVTGKEWSGTEKSIREGKISSDAAREFVDYFIFGGRGEKLAKRFGIKELSFINDENTKGFEVKKTVTQNVDVGYGLEQTSAQTEQGAVSQKVAVDYSVSDDTLVSIEGTVETKSEKADTLANQDTANDASVTMTLKRSF